MTGSFRGLNVSCTLRVNTLIWPLSIFYIRHLSFLCPPVADCDGYILGDTVKRPASFSTSDYKHSNFFSWAVWLLLWTQLSHSFQQWCICSLSSKRGDTEELKETRVVSTVPLPGFSPTLPHMLSQPLQQKPLLPAQTGGCHCKGLAGSWMCKEPARLALLPLPPAEDKWQQSEQARKIKRQTTACKPPFLMCHHQAASISGKDCLKPNQEGSCCHCHWCFGLALD